MSKKFKDYRWSNLRRLREVLSNEEIIYSPINAIKTMKIIELKEVCEFVSYTKKDDKSNYLYEELKKYLRNNKTLILNSSTICPGVNTTILNSMTIDLLNDELTEEEIMKLSSYENSLNNQQVLKKVKK